jgi:hypothetical protein
MISNLDRGDEPVRAWAWSAEDALPKMAIHVDR